MGRRNRQRDGCGVVRSTSSPSQPRCNALPRLLATRSCDSPEEVCLARSDIPTFRALKILTSRAVPADPLPQACRDALDDIHPDVRNYAVMIDSRTRRPKFHVYPEVPDECQERLQCLADEIVALWRDEAPRREQGKNADLRPTCPSRRGGCRTRADWARAF